MKDTSDVLGPKYVANTSEAIMINNTPTLYYIPNGSTFDAYLADEENSSPHLLAANCPGGAIEVVDSLTDSSTDKPLSANMGKILAFNLQLLKESLANIAFVSVPEFLDMGVDTSQFKFSVTANLTHCALSNAEPVTRFDSFSSVVTADSGYEISSVIVTMGGTDITATAYSNGTITISRVTGAISITATCIKDSNIGYKVTWAYSSSSPAGTMFGLNDEVFAISRKIDNVAGHSLTFSVGVLDKACGLLVFNKDTGRFYTNNICNAATVTKTIPDNCYVRLSFKQEYINTYGDSLYVYDNTTGEYLLKGSEITLESYGNGDDYELTNECPTLADENGNYLSSGVTFSNSANKLTSMRDTFTHMPIVFKRLAGTFTTMLSPVFTVDEDTDVDFWIGEYDSNKGLVVYKSTIAGWAQNSSNGNPRTVTLTAGTKFQLFLTTSNLANAYIKNHDTGEYFWRGADYIEQSNNE